MIDNSEKFCLFLTEKHLKMLFLYVFSLASCFAEHWLLVFVSGFLKVFQNVEKTKNPSCETGFWTTRANTLVAQTTGPGRRITSYSTRVIMTVLKSTISQSPSDCLIMKRKIFSPMGRRLWETNTCVLRTEFF